MNSITQKPWGHFQILDHGKNYLVKNILVKPGGKLSLQNHQHRSEHWVVVKGVGTITVNETKQTLQQNESIFIPKQSKHRLENMSDEDLIIIEIQYGNILREDDIIRYEDIYDRI